MFSLMIYKLDGLKWQAFDVFFFSSFRKDNSVIMNSYLPLLLALVAVPLYAAPAAPMNMTCK